MARRLTPEAVARICGALDPKGQTSDGAHLVIWQAERDYQFALNALKENGNFQDHLQRLSSIEAAARKLKQLLEAEPLLHNILTATSETTDSQTDDYIDTVGTTVSAQVTLDEAELLRSIARVSYGAQLLSADRELLRSARFDPNLKDALKSPERRHLWTPIFHFCIENAVKLTFYENGRLYKALAILHEELGAPALKAGSLRRAIEEYVHEPSILDDGEISIWQDADAT